MANYATLSQPATHDSRESVRSQAYFSMSWADLPTLLLVAASLLVWRWLAKRGIDAIPLRERPAVERDAATPLLAIVGWVLVISAVSQIAGITDEPSLHNVQVSCIGGAVTLLFLTLLLAYPVNPRAPRRDLAAFGITLESAGRAARDGTIGFLASLAPVFAVLMLTAHLRDDDLQHSFLQLLQREPDGAIIAWIVLAAAVIAPLTEELLFRVILQGWLESRLGPGPAIAIVAVIFAAVHNWPDMLPLIPLAVVLGVLYHRSNSYVAIVVAHALLNASMLALTLIEVLGERGP